MSINKEKAEAAIYQFLEAIGENPNREGLLDTPKRVAKMYAEMFAGLNKDPKEEFTAVFTEHHEDVVIVKDISFYSMCEHHLVPFYGKAHIAYLPSDGLTSWLFDTSHRHAHVLCFNEDQNACWMKCLNQSVCNLSG